MPEHEESGAGAGTPVSEPEHPGVVPPAAQDLPPGDPAPAPKIAAQPGAAFGPAPPAAGEMPAGTVATGGADPDTPEMARLKAAMKPWAVSDTLKQELTEDDRTALEMPTDVKLAGRTFQVYPLPIGVLDLIVHAYVELLAEYHGPEPTEEKLNNQQILEVLQGAAEVQSHQVLRVLQVMLTKPTRGPITWKDLEPDWLHLAYQTAEDTLRRILHLHEKPRNWPSQKWLRWNVTPAGIEKVFLAFCTKNDFLAVLKKVMAVEALATRARAAMRAEPAASPAPSSLSSARPAGQTTTSSGGSAGAA